MAAAGSGFAWEPADGAPIAFAMLGCTVGGNIDAAEPVGAPSDAVGAADAPLGAAACGLQNRMWGVAGQTGACEAACGALLAGTSIDLPRQPSEPVRDELMHEQQLTIDQVTRKHATCLKNGATRADRPRRLRHARLHARHPRRARLRPPLARPARASTSTSLRSIGR